MSRQARHDKEKRCLDKLDMTKRRDISTSSTEIRAVATAALYIQNYFTGMFSRTALRNSQHFATEGMFARSSGE